MQYNGITFSRLAQKTQPSNYVNCNNLATTVDVKHGEEIIFKHCTKPSEHVDYPRCKKNVYNNSQWLVNLDNENSMCMYYTSAV